jgi:hypothetical protein
MTNSNAWRIASISTFWVSLCIFLGVWAHGQEVPKPLLKGQQAKERMEAARLEVANVRSNVFLTLVQLDRVRGERGPDRPQFRIFVAQLDRMQEIAKAFGRRAEEMKQRGAAYFQDWESQPQGRNPERLAERKQCYDHVTLFIQQAKTSFLDFNAILFEIKSLLENNPSAADIANAKDLFGKANWRCLDVQRALANMEVQFDRLAASFAKDEAETGSPSDRN